MEHSRKYDILKNKWPKSEEKMVWDEMRSSVAPTDDLCPPDSIDPSMVDAKRFSKKYNLAYSHFAYPPFYQFQP